MAREVVIVGAARTPIGAFQGALSPLTAPQLGAIAIKAALERAGLKPELVEQVIMGNVLTAGVGQAPARQAARGAGLPDGVPCITINKVCGSGLQSVALAYNGILAGDYDFAVAGGQESMTNAPYLSSQLRGGARIGHGGLIFNRAICGTAARPGRAAQNPSRPGPRTAATAHPSPRL